MSEVISISLAYGRLRQSIFAPPYIKTNGGIRVEADTDVPEDEVWFCINGVVKQRVKIESEP